MDLKWDFKLYNFATVISVKFQNCRSIIKVQIQMQRVNDQKTSYLKFLEMVYNMNLYDFSFSCNSKENFSHEIVFE